VLNRTTIKFRFRLVYDYASYTVVIR